MKSQRCILILWRGVKGIYFLMEELQHDTKFPVNAYFLKRWKFCIRKTILSFGKSFTLWMVRFPNTSKFVLSFILLLAFGILYSIACLRVVLWTCWEVRTHLLHDWNSLFFWLSHLGSFFASKNARFLTVVSGLTRANFLFRPQPTALLSTENAFCAHRKCVLCPICRKQPSRISLRESTFENQSSRINPLWK